MEPIDQVQAQNQNGISEFVSNLEMVQRHLENELSPIGFHQNYNTSLFLRT